MNSSNNKNYGRKVIRQNKRRQFVAWCIVWFIAISVITVFVCGLIHLICCFKVEASEPTVIEEPMIVEVEEPKIVEPIVEPISLGEYKLTAYCSCEKCCGVWALNRPIDEDGQPIINTASGTRAIEGVTIAADTNILPFGTKVYIDGHEYVVQDRGGAIKGNKIDVYFDHHQEALEFGVQYKEVFTVVEDRKPMC